MRLKLESENKKMNISKLYIHWKNDCCTYTIVTYVDCMTQKLGEVTWIVHNEMPFVAFSKYINIVIRSHQIKLTHWGRVTHICVHNLTITGPDNGLSPGRHQAIIWTNAGILLIGPLGTNFSELLIGIQTFSFKKMQLKTSSAKRRPFCFGLDVLTDLPLVPNICLSKLGQHSFR